MKAKKKLSPSARRIVFLACAAALAAAVLLGIHIFRENRPGLLSYREKIGLLRDSALSEATRGALGADPAGEKAGNAVFISICDTAQRASVFTGVGADVDAAWDAADDRVQDFLKKNDYDPQWVKADVVCSSEKMTEAQLLEAVRGTYNEFFRYGIAFDPMYETALLEAELNGAKVFNYEDSVSALDYQYLNLYLSKAGRPELTSRPAKYTVFRCLGWFCDEADQIYPLCNEGLEYGRRSVELIDDAYAKQLLLDAGSFLVDQVNPDGSFLYGIYPRFDNEIENYNILRHASTIWSLICLWRVTGDDSLQAVADSAIDYMRNYIRYEDADTAYLYEEKADEIKLGGNGVAVIAMTEYMDAFGSDKYRDDCRALGNGILRMFDEESGEFYHVLNGDFSRKEEYRTVYYDGEATFALCRLYALTGEELWLNAAKAAVDHFIEADYTQYRDHWIAYSMNEITRYVDDPDYYDFALRNAQENLDEIYNRETTYHTYLELLMSTFELYDRMAESGIRTDYMENTFSVEDLLRTIYARADRMLNGFFFPEYAMYMRNPSRILNTFMVRHDGYRVRIDDVQHNIGGFYKYYVNYDRLVKYGMLEDIGK